MSLDAQKLAAYRRATDWNFTHPPGSPVLAWPGTRDAEPLRTRSRHSAWVLPSGVPVVRIVHHAGGIHLDHIEDDPTRQPAVPDIEFSSPPCPICGDALNVDADGFDCITCGASWSANGQNGQWNEPVALRCPAIRSWRHDKIPDEQCTLAADHGPLHRPADGHGEWTDDHQDALVDSHGEQLR